MKLDILGISHAVLTVPGSALPPDANGSCDANKAEIQVDETLAPGVDRRTLIHEVLHAIDDALELGLTEVQVVGMAAGLNSIPQLRIGAAE